MLNTQDIKSATEIKSLDAEPQTQTPMTKAAVARLTRSHPTDDFVKAAPLHRRSDYS
jgi:hypothetical protein